MKCPVDADFLCDQGGDNGKTLHDPKLNFVRKDTKCMS